MLKRIELFNIKSSYLEMLNILDNLEVDYESFDGGYCATDEHGNIFEMCPCICIRRKSDFALVVFEFDFHGENGYYYIKE